MRAFVATLVALLVPLTVHAMAGKEKAFGAGVTGEDRVKLADLVANPEAYVGQTVRVEGVISKLQEQQGAFVELSDGGATLRVDVDARKMSFPDDALGKRVAVQGVFAKRVVPAKAGRADVAQAEPHGKSDLETGEHGKSEYAKAAEHGKSGLARAEKEADEHGDKAGKHEKGEKPAKTEKAEKHADGGPAEAPDHDAAKPEKAEQPERAPRHAEVAPAADTVVYELEGTGAILL